MDLRFLNCSFLLFVAPLPSQSSWAEMVRGHSASVVLYLSSTTGTFSTFCMVTSSFLCSLLPASPVPALPALCSLLGLIWKFCSVLYQSCLVHFSMFYHKVQFENNNNYFFYYSIVKWMLPSPLQQPVPLLPPPACWEPRARCTFVFLSLAASPSSFFLPFFFSWISIGNK